MSCVCVCVCVGVCVCVCGCVCVGGGCGCGCLDLDLFTSPFTSSPPHSLSLRICVSVLGSSRRCRGAVAITRSNCSLLRPLQLGDTDPFVFVLLPQSNRSIRAGRSQSSIFTQSKAKPSKAKTRGGKEGGGEGNKADAMHKAKREKAVMSG